jgi:hypothetical protein
MSGDVEVRKVIKTTKKKKKVTIEGDNRSGDMNDKKDEV